MKKPENSSRRQTKNIALSGLISALCFVAMYLASIIDVIDLSAVVLCSMLVIISVIEIGKHYPWLIWLVASVLCLLFLPRKDIALEFVMFGGIYPILKAKFEKLPTLPSWIVKIVFFNAVFTGWFFLSKYLFALDVGLELGIIAYVAANVFFVLADIFFTLMISMYITKIRPRLGFGKK